MYEAYLDSITNSYFKTRDDGTKIFYPQGALGRVGYIVPSPELEELLRARARRFFIGSMLGGTLLGVCLSELAIGLQIPVVAFVATLFAISCLLAWLGARGFFWQFTRQMTAVQEANSFKRCWLEVVQSLRPWFVGLMATVCLLFVVASLVTYRSTGESKLLLMAAVFMILLVPWVLATWIHVRAKETKR